MMIESDVSRVLKAIEKAKDAMLQRGGGDGEEVVIFTALDSAEDLIKELTVL